MAKFHINPLTGNAGVCTAELRSCLYASAEEHYDSREAAAAAYEASRESSSLGGRRNVASDTLRVPEATGLQDADMNRMSLPSISGRFVSAGARDLFSSLGGSKSYEETIANAKARAAYANYKAAPAPAPDGIEDHSRPAPEGQAPHTLEALAAYRAGKLAPTALNNHGTAASARISRLHALALSSARG